MDAPGTTQEKGYMENNERQIYGYELLQSGLNRLALMKILYECEGIISIQELSMNINLKEINEPFSNDLIPSIIIKKLIKFGPRPYIDGLLLKNIIKKSSLLTGKRYSFNPIENVKNKFNIFIPSEWYIEIALDISLVDFKLSTIWLEDNDYKNINRKREIFEEEVEKIRAKMHSPNIAEEAQKWKDFAKTQTGKNKKAALAAAKKWEGATHIQTYDYLFPQKNSYSIETKNSYMSRLMNTIKTLAQENKQLKIYQNK